MEPMSALNREGRENYMLSLAKKALPDEKVTLDTMFRGTSIRKLCEFDGGGYKRMISWLESKQPKKEIKYDTKDSGKRREYQSGYNRDTDENKPRYDLIPPECLKRLAELFARGAKKYGEFNWQKAETIEEFQSFKASAFRHFMDWQEGKEDEDHAMGAVINIFFYEWVTKHKK